MAHRIFFFFLTELSALERDWLARLESRARERRGAPVAEGPLLHAGHKSLRPPAHPAAEAARTRGGRAGRGSGLDLVVDLLTGNPSGTTPVSRGT